MTTVESCAILYVRLAKNQKVHTLAFTPRKKYFHHNARTNNLKSAWGRKEKSTFVKHIGNYLYAVMEKEWDLPYAWARMYQGYVQI